MNKAPLIFTSLIVLAISGCASDNIGQIEKRLQQTQQENKQLRQKVSSLQQSGKVDLSSTMASEQSNTKNKSDNLNELLPPDAQKGECYARVWVEPQYETTSKRIKTRPATESVKIIPARYKTVKERVLVQEAATKVSYTAPLTAVVREKILVQEPLRRWQTSLTKGGALASDDLLKKVRGGHGIDLDNAKSGTCYHEHYLPGKTITELKKVMVKAPIPRNKGNQVQYHMVNKKVMVQEASTKLKYIPATYAWEYEEILIKPAHSIWKKGKGPIQRIDEATGEIMCLVEMPAEYQRIKKRVIKTPARTDKINVPAVYKTVKVRELASADQLKNNVSAAQYKNIKIVKGYEDGNYVWHEIHNTDHSTKTRTGRKVCLITTPAKYQTVTRTVVKKEGRKIEVNVPAKYSTLTVNKLVSEERVNKSTTPAEYKNVSSSALVKDGFMEWRSILCDTNMTSSRVTQIQRALKTEGFNPGPIDGVVGSKTMRAVNAFQRDKGLPVDRYLNMQTIRALNINI